MSIEIGFKFGRRVVVGGPSRDATGHIMWEVQCQCGQTKVIKQREILKGFANSCISCARLKNDTSTTTCVEAGYYNLVQAVARRKGREFTVSIEYLCELWMAQGGHCALSGLPIQIGKVHRGHTGSLDRIDSSKGYVPGNVQWLHKDINRMKMDHDQEEFLELCRTIAKHNP